MMGQRSYAECRDAFIKMAQAGTELVHSSLLDLELVEAAYRVALRERYGKRWKQARPDGRARGRAARLAENAMASWSSIRKTLPSTCIEASDVTPAVPPLMRTHALGSYDAVHVATALHAGVHVIAALDAGFARVPASRLTIHTVSGRLARMRAVRAGRITPDKPLTRPLRRFPVTTGVRASQAIEEDRAER